MDNPVIYEKFDWESFRLEQLDKKVNKVLENIPEDVKTILDVGCGNGLITNILGEKYEVTGVDRSEAALAYVKTKKIRADANSIPLPDRNFDLVFSSELLEHLDEKTFKGTLKEFSRLTRKYLFLTVPNRENPDKLLIKCSSCGYIYNRPNHLRSFSAKYLASLFPDFELIDTFVSGKKVRYYNPALLQLKRKLTPSSSWIPYYWIPENNRKSVCPRCEHEFEYKYKFNPMSTSLDILNAVISPKRPYWLFMVMKRNNEDL